MLPDQSPDAVQVPALVEDQVKVELPPLVTLVGLALIETVGGVADTVTVADWLALPPAPVQVKAYVVLDERAPVLYVPLTASVPLHAPDAEHEVALVEDQKVLLPANGFALLMGITKDFGAVSRLPQLSEPCVAV